jgi:SAM-dependent methyltransferase
MEVARGGAARSVRSVVGRVMAPTVQAIEDRNEELSGRVDAHAGLADEQRRIAEDLANLHLWIDEHVASLDPDHGGSHLAQRVAELSGELRSLERRFRDGVRAGAPAPAPSGSAPAAPVPAPSAPSIDALLGYDAFERRFRGEAADIAAEQVRRYGELLAGCSPVLDIGCGRGELLRELRDRGTEVVGVEPSATMAAEARSHGLEVHERLGADHLRTVPDGSLGAIVTLQVVEHLQLADLVELLDLAAAKLRPGGIFVAETPNPAAWVVMHTSFILDPSHVWPLSPQLLTYLCERSGFVDVRVEYFSPATSMQVPLVEDPEAPPWVATVNEALASLNHVLFGPQDYAVVCRVPSR